MKISFFGAADAVTGSRHLVEWGGQRVLLDCGMFQGYKALRERNWAPFPVPPREIDAVVLSHAHLDHSGYLPALVKQGFKGRIYTSLATKDLCQVLLLDSAHLQEEDARRANRYGTSKHEKALPLYTVLDAKKALAHIDAVAPGRTVSLGKLKLSFTPAGHLLGASSVCLSLGDRRLVFSGDLGRSNDLLMPPPQPQTQADVLLIESTYGNRLHPAEDVQTRLGQIIRTTVQRGGSVLLPTFAVGRAQALLLVLQRLKDSGEMPDNLPIFLDSPMAIEATQLTLKHRKLLRVSNAEASRLCDGVTLVTKPAQSQRLANSRWPSIILSASGMATGGRVLTHLKRMAPDARNHVVFPGFQVGGSRGAKLVAGAREVKIHGEYVPVNAQISHLEGFSGHADADDLMAWMRQFQAAPEQVYVVHGEPEASDALRSRIQDELHWPVRVPQHGETVSH